MMLRSSYRCVAAAAGAAAAIAILGSGYASGTPEAAADGKQLGGGSAPRGPRFSHPRQIDNRYLPLSRWRQCVYRGKTKKGATERSVFTRLDRTKRFTYNGHAFDAAVFEDKDFEGGKHVETAIDYFAQSDDGTVYYLGENVSNFEGGKLADHEGTWLLGRQTDVPGVAMPPKPHVGDRWHFEDVPPITSESDVVEERGLRTQAAGRLFTDVIRVQEFTQPQGELEYKLYAAGVGIVVSYDPESRTELVGCR
ncbi:MAG: hypothetical protein ACXVFT_20635 [Solirubrobacteraceae bacterium]